LIQSFFSYLQLFYLHWLFLIGFYFQFHPCKNSFEPISFFFSKLLLSYFLLFFLTFVSFCFFVWFY
jgi:hypothetical protein